jgi:hypothetical protein
VRREAAAPALLNLTGRVSSGLVPKDTAHLGDGISRTDLNRNVTEIRAIARDVFTGLQFNEFALALRLWGQVLRDVLSGFFGRHRFLFGLSASTAGVKDGKRTGK